MNETPELNDAEVEARPTEVARRTMLKHGAKLGYIIPLILSAAWATPAHAAPPPSGGGFTPGPRIRLLSPERVPAELLALIEAAERRSIDA